MAAKALPSPEVLRQLLRYEPDTGKLFWKERGPEWFSNGGAGREAAARRWNSRLAGREAFTASVSGYRSGCLFDQCQFAHRVVWAIMTNAWPVEIDHINGNRQDNRWINLREASHASNQKNYPTPKSNTSGVMGVYWAKDVNKWRATIRANGKKVCLGSYDGFDDAVAAQMAARAEFGYHKNHGRTA